MLLVQQCLMAGRKYNYSNELVQDEFNNITMKAAEDIRKNEKSVLVQHEIFSCMVILQVLLYVFFALVIFANMTLLSSYMLTELMSCILYS